ncbi:ABC transporter ATP-binding protein [Microbaculum marinisediminis]|uniref:Nickel import system ATP-binding protein NikD n=1 Tax=Microbaculum marinisediminis TaxID=2931392 RepID=A0AAW5QWX9_9HYPH|nr:ABC transporter ATP-binding protein [Microbaculum sp. A6E488]MCT8970903.1 ABC transporter ATP-binding protein [Microbaculum sp. A6E488]
MRHVSAGSGNRTETMLSVSDLSLELATYDGTVQVLDNINLAVGRRETIGVVGETGCGKSVLAKSVLDLLPRAIARYRRGSIRWKGENLLSATRKRLRQVRGTEIGMVFQDPMTFFDPLYTAGSYMMEAIGHRERVKGDGGSRARRKAEAIDLLGRLGLTEPDRVFDSYPHQLSGGMRQRVLIAAAIAGSPELIIADEPTTALDVTVQAQILHLLKEIVETRDTSILLISHDLGVIASMCERIVVMYAGTIVETGTKRQLLSRPAHPYTIGLISAVPRLGYPQKQVKGIAGHIPNLLNPPPGCRFAPRCHKATALCRKVKPELATFSGGRQVACHHPEPFE